MGNYLKENGKKEEKNPQDIYEKEFEKILKYIKEAGGGEETKKTF